MELASLYSSFALSPLAWYLVWLPRTYCPSTPNTADPISKYLIPAPCMALFAHAPSNLSPRCKVHCSFAFPYLYCSSRHQHTYLHSCRDWCLHLLFFQHYSFPLVPYRWCSWLTKYFYIPALDDGANCLSGQRISKLWTGILHWGLHNIIHSYIYIHIQRVIAFRNETDSDPTIWLASHSTCAWPCKQTYFASNKI